MIFGLLTPDFGVCEEEMDKKFYGPVIDRDIFGGDIPEYYSSKLPYFFVQDAKDPLNGKKFKFEFDFNRLGWVWNSKY